MVRVIFQMPPGRGGFTTMKTIEETLRSKAGVLGTTRKEIPVRLERLGQMGVLRQSARQRGSGQVMVGELNLEHPAVMRITEGMERPEAQRAERAASPRRARGRRTREAEPVPTTTAALEPAAQTGAAFTDITDGTEPAETAPAAAGSAAPAPDQPAFRWVSGVEEALPGGERSLDGTAGVAGPGEAETGTEAEPARAKRRTARKPAARKATTTRKPATRKKYAQANPGDPAEDTGAGTADMATGQDLSPPADVG